MTPDAAPIPLMQCPIAGFQFHGGNRCKGRIRPGDPLELRREPGNRHDPRAITVAWQGVTLGYVPREANYALSQMMDRGARVAARVTALREGGDPWQRVMIEVAVGALPAALVVAKPPAREEVILMPGRPMHKAPLTLAPWPMATVPPELNRAGEVLVLSIRGHPTDERLACFAASRDRPGQPWTLIEVAGKMNTAVNEKIARVAEGVVAKMNALLHP